jgi:PAS domain S-box-containing protein
MDISQPILSSREIELFQAMPGNCAMLLPDAPTFTIAAVTGGYLEISGRHRDDLIGKGLFAAFPNTPDDPEETSVKRLRASLEQAISSKESHCLPLHRYDIPMPNGSFDERWWSAVNRPVLDESGTVLYVIHSAEDVTLKIKAEQRENRIHDLEKSHNLFMQAPVAIGIAKGSDYIIEMANDSLLEVWGRSADVIGKPLFDAIPELSSQGYRELLDQILQTGEPFYGYEHPVRLNRGGKEELFYFDFVYKPYYESGLSRPAGVFTVGHNVTEQVQARQKVEESEDLFRSFSNNIQNLAWLADGEGWIHWYNDRWYEYTGTTLTEMQGWGWEKVHHPDHKESVISFVKEAWKRDKPWELTFPLRGADGEYRWFLTRAVPILNEDGKIVRWIGTNTNVDEQVRAKAALKQKQEELQQIFFQAPVSITVMRTPNFIVEVANQMALQMWGKDEEQVLGKPVFAIEPGIREQQEPWLQSIVASRKPFEGKEVPVQYLKNGQPYAGYYDFVHQPLIDVEDNISGIVAIGTEVTHSVEARNKIEESEKELQRIFYQAPVSMVVYKGEDLVVQVASKMALDLWGKTEEEVIGRPFFDISPELQEGQEALFRQVRETGEPFIAKEFPVQYVRYGKEHFIYYDFVFQPLRNENGEITAVVSIGNDVTHSVVARKEIEESENRFRTLAETLPQMIWMRNMDGKIEFGSKNWERYSGISDVSEAWQAMAHPEDWKAIMSVWEQSVASSTPFRYEVRLKNKEGEYRWHNASGEPVRNEKGEVVKWIGALTDVHEQKTFAEKLERIVQERTIELQRSNEDLQQFAHVASHDLKEPVRKVITFNSRLREELGKNISERAATYLSKIEGASVRMYSMIDGVLLYSSLNALEQTKELIDLEELIENIQTDLEVLIQQKEATLQYSNLPSLEGSAILIYQLFYNLVSNSLKFAKVGVPPVIEFSAQKSTAEELAKAGINNKRHYVKLLLRDNGIGFSNDEAKKIFRTFTRLHSKDKYEGTGLGLSLCRKIAERHGGAIWAEGEQGEGATFTVLLPKG